MDTTLALHILATCHSVFTSLVCILYGYRFLEYGSAPQWLILFIYGCCSLVFITLAWLTERHVMFISTTCSVIFLLTYFLVIPGDAEELDWARFRLIAVLSCVNWYAIARVAQDKEPVHTLRIFFRHMQKRFLLRYIIQVLMFLIGMIPGAMMPFGCYLTCGHSFLPIPEVYWGTAHEETAIWTRFVWCGLSAMWLPACFSTWLCIRGTGGISRVITSFLSGLAAGAACFMLYHLPGAWVFLLR